MYAHKNNSKQCRGCTITRGYAGQRNGGGRVEKGGLGKIKKKLRNDDRSLPNRAVVQAAKVVPYEEEVKLSNNRTVWVHCTYEEIRGVKTDIHVTRTDNTDPTQCTWREFKRYRDRGGRVGYTWDRTWQPSRKPGGGTYGSWQRIGLRDEDLYKVAAAEVRAKEYAENM